MDRAGESPCRTPEDRMGKYFDRIKAASQEVDAAAEARNEAERKHAPSYPPERLAAERRAEQAGMNAYRALAGKDPKGGR